MSTTTLDGAWFALLGGVFGILVVASVVGTWLSGRPLAADGQATVENLNARIRAWWVMVLVFALALAGGRTGATVLFGVMSFLALREFVTLTPARRGDHESLFWSFFVFLPLHYWLVGTAWYGLFTILIPVYAFLFLPLRSALNADTRGFLERTAKIQWGLMVCVYCVSHAPALLMLDIPGYAGHNAQLLVWLVLVVQMSDVLQYVCGKLWGRRPIVPKLSPSKTVEGFVGGIAAASAIGAALWWVTPFAPWQAGLIALLVTLLGFAGGLVMSAIKRDVGVKDFGAILEGHGGMLDRIDSLCFAAPVFFHVVRYWFTP
ncbi:phosphatidate cytidylyltransferase [Plasticicumulans lactativorans]|uniref:Phosphatidate cytidylyltransferase n=1 Tax=Plasticicumulans lactativorans TaxID=1133106 RepID=A0A4R2LG52_9GAMM|nr:phosphatidate cytidylyltransferase [Plasticicumulans lactativorans]TCO81944.1 phosphatidate cytidylyltransferase [Plasticicumulans lactativorans]